MLSLSSPRYAVIAFGCASCPKITCGREGCGTEFCYHCKQLWHPNQTCDAARQQRAQSLRLRTLRSSSLSYSQESGAAGWPTEYRLILSYKTAPVFSCDFLCMSIKALASRTLYYRLYEQNGMRIWGHCFDSYGQDSNTYVNFGFLFRSSYYSLWHACSNNFFLSIMKF